MKNISIIQALLKLKDLKHNIVRVSMRRKSFVTVTPQPAPVSGAVCEAVENLGKVRNAS